MGGFVGIDIFVHMVLRRIWAGLTISGLDRFLRIKGVELGDVLARFAKKITKVGWLVA
jgi:hypothetical protein